MPVSGPITASSLTPLGLQACSQILDQALAGRFEAAQGQLTELALCSRLGVSRTPVRMALQYLHGVGVLAHEPRRGWRLVAGRAQLQKARRALPQDEALALYYGLLRDRTSGLLASKVTEHEIRQHYQARASVVREVLMRLLQDGILRGRSGLRWEFAETMDADNERESYRFRIVIECAALAEPGFQVDKRRLEASRQRQQALIAHATRRSWLEFFDANAEVHELLASASGNRYYLRAVQEQNRLRRISDLSDYPLVDVEALQRSCREHLAVLDAVAAGELGRAAGILRAHLERASDLLEQRVAGTLEPARPLAPRAS
ncbi:FCD domain-containing protein [Xylophilus rhododendri]|uniref:FCD domain-containing protein n=1 Tax=Xylophilus rhododendri TaxID=2697032 RepID=A0A857JCC4_9BURK|nr:GntR family transcriptional regulator [Xylophilus rhododendri]QHJ00613.1 FCD domain-containing protein [Xylophilus rhododendri]